MTSHPSSTNPPSETVYRSSVWRVGTAGHIHALVLLLYTVLTGIMTWPLAANLTSAIPGDSFDGWQNYWNLWWLKIALVERVQNPFVTDLLYAPTGVGLYFHTLNPFNGVVTLPIQLSGGLMAAYNSVVWISWVLGGYGVFLLTLWVLRRGGQMTIARYGAAFLAGVIFTFSPFHMAHLLGHMQVMSLQWMPFYILYLLRGVDRVHHASSWRRDGLMAGLFLALVGLCDWYFVLYLFLFTGVFVIWQLGGTLYTQRRIQLSLLYPALTAGIVFLLLLSPILYPMIVEALRFDFMERPVTDLYILSATLADFVIPNRLHTLFRPESFAWIGNQIAPVSERTISVGYLALVLAAMGGIWDRRRTGFWWAIALVFILIALGPAFKLQTITWTDVPGDPPSFAWTPYDLLNRTIPFMRISRSVSRFSVIVQLALAVAAAAGLTLLLRRRSRQAAAALTFAALLVVLAEYWVAPYPISPPDTPAYYTQIAADDAQGAVLNLPMNYDRPGYLLYQTIHQKPLSVAYISRDDPRTYTERVPILQHFRHLGPDILEVDASQIGSTVLTDLGIDWVILDRYKMPGGVERDYTTALAAAIFADSTPAYEDERLTVYRTQPPPSPQPYLILGATGWGALQPDSVGQPSRTIGEGPALLTLRHVPAGAELTFQYRSDAPIDLILPAANGEKLATLPPVPLGGSFTLSLDPLRNRLGIGPADHLNVDVALSMGPADMGQIRGIRLSTP